MKTKSSGDGLGVGMCGYENLAVFSEDRGAKQEMLLLSALGGFLVNKHHNESSLWRLRFKVFQVSQLSDKASHLN